MKTTKPLRCAIYARYSVEDARNASSQEVSTLPAGSGVS